MEWNNSYCIGVDKIDSQHKRWLKMVTQLENSIGNDNISTTMGNTLKSIVDYTNYHFKVEEDLMAQINFSRYNEQQKMHRDLIDQVRNILLDIRNGNPPSAADLINFLRTWIIDHIEKEDRKIGLELEKLKGRGAGKGGGTLNASHAPIHVLKEKLEKLKSLAADSLISKEELDAQKNELLNKFISEFNPVNTIGLIEAFESFNPLKQNELIDGEDEKRIRDELSGKLDISAVLSSDESVEESLANLKSLFEKKIIAQDVYDQFKKEALSKMH